MDHLLKAGSSAAAIWAYRWRDWLFAMDRLFNTGLRAGFANTGGLPNVWQVNLNAARQLPIPWLGQKLPTN
jgi:hypothetical protein